MGDHGQHFKIIHYIHFNLGQSPTSHPQTSVKEEKIKHKNHFTHVFKDLLLTNFPLCLSIYSIQHPQKAKCNCFGSLISAYPWLDLHLSCQSHSAHLTARGSIALQFKKKKKGHTQTCFVFFYISDRSLSQRTNTVIVAVAFNLVASGCWKGFQETEPSALIMRFDPFL